MKIIKITLPLLLLAAMGCSSPKDVEPVKLKFDESSFSNESISLSLSLLQLESGMYSSELSDVESYS